VAKGNMRRIGGKRGSTTIGKKLTSSSVTVIGVSIRKSRKKALKRQEIP